MRVGRIGVKFLSSQSSLRTSSPDSPVLRKTQDMAPSFDSPRKPSSWFSLPLNCKNTRKGVFTIVRVGRIELPSVAWEATILPLNDTRNNKDKITKTSSQIKLPLLEQIDHTVKKPTNRRYYLCQTPRCKRSETVIFLITTII